MTEIKAVPLSPALRPDFRLRDGDIVNADNDVVARCIRAERRFAWDFERLGASRELQAIARKEADDWDDWATRRKGRPDTDHHPDLDVGKWLARCPEFKKVLSDLDCPVALTDKTILNIGGTGWDLGHWLSERPRHVDHVEVSAASQEKCRKKVERHEATYDIPAPITFHTLPAEHLPFADDAFDFVFARSTLHHCARPQVLDEAFRVLKPGGLLLFSEYFLSDALYAMMKAERTMLKRDRGSDDPLRISAIAHCDSLFASTGGKSAKVFHAPIYSYVFRRFCKKRAASALALKVVYAGVK